jgi:hypothetical protein
MERSRDRPRMRWRWRDILTFQAAVHPEGFGAIRLQLGSLWYIVGQLNWTWQMSANDPWPGQC